MACQNIGGCTSLKCDPCFIVDQKQNNEKTSNQAVSRYMEDAQIYQMTVLGLEHHH